ncbi:MAG: hypothetical protein COA74_00060 [Gammaproteobacteria bacterium]|nr:MAG: hypothetical protein COA74_00060 [Gammaproteobacteria bacterium]
MVFKTGCWSFILVGTGHIVTSIFIPNTPERIKIVQEMKNFSISMSGTESNLYLFHEGFSLMMGILLIGYGLLNLSLTKASTVPENKIIIINLTVSLIAFVISIKQFFIVPVIFLCIASLSFHFSYTTQSLLVIFGNKKRYRNK